MSVSKLEEFGWQNTGAQAGLGAGAPDLDEANGMLRELAAAFLGRIWSAQPSKDGDAAGVMDESSLPSMEARYRVLVEQIPAVVFMAFLDGGLSEAYVSPQIEQMLGFSQEEWLDDPVRWYQQIHTEDRARWSAEAAESFVTGKPLKSVYRVIARDGRVVWFHCEAKLVRKRSGEPWFIHGVGFDITGLKETEQALQREVAERERLQRLELERQIAKAEQSESRLAAIVESSEDAIIGKTLDGVVRDWNAAATRLFGYEPEEIVGKSILLLVPPDLHEQEKEMLRKLREGERVAHKQTQRVTKAGEYLEVSLTISPIYDAAGRVVGASTIVRDITEQTRTAERLRIAEKLAATGRLAATISHEINNPLEAVTNFIYLAKSDPSLSAQTRQHLEVADRELQRVTHIARQTLGFYRDTTSPMTFDIGRLLDDVLDLYRGKIEYKRLRVDRRYGEQEIHALLGEIRQVFSNILVNAIEASPEEGVIVLRAQAGGDWKRPGTAGIRVSIADQGRGIARSARTKICQPFYSTKQNVGTGLGLWVSKNLVEKNGGWIAFRSCVVPGRSGTVFCVFLPCASATHAAAA